MCQKGSKKWWKCMTLAVHSVAGSLGGVWLGSFGWKSPVASSFFPPNSWCSNWTCFQMLSNAGNNGYPVVILGAIWSQGWCNFLVNEGGAKEPQNPQNHRGNRVVCFFLPIDWTLSTSRVKNVLVTSSTNEVFIATWQVATKRNFIFRLCLVHPRSLI